MEGYKRRKVFITIGDSAFFETIYLNVKSISKIYPDDYITVVDIGFTTEEVKKIAEVTEKVNVVRELIDRNEDVAIMAMVLKPIALMGYANSGMDLIWMDGDAVLLQNIDELFEYNADIIVTTREIERENARINAGLIVFLDNTHFILISWIKQIIQEVINNKSRWSEQDALNKIIYNGSFRFQEVSCEEYNFPRLEEGITDSRKVVHLKKGRNKDKALLDLVKEKVDEK
jgi:hypothetical protein